MTFTSLADIDRIYFGIIDKSLPKSEWTHEAHFAAAVAMCLRQPAHAFDRISETIKSYNVATGVENTDTDGYHYTITKASMMATQSVISEAPDDTAVIDITNMMITGKYGKPDWLLAHWSKDVLFSVAARRGWVAPDIHPV